MQSPEEVGEIPTREGFIEYLGYKTWYQIANEYAEGVPLIVAHGGPGFPHHAQKNIASLSAHGYPVVLYDQLGCGNSDKPDDTSLWVVDTFVEELEELRKQLGFEKFNLMGQSWGGSLAVEYALKYGGNVDKLVLHSPLIDTRLWVEETDKLKDLLPDNAGQRMRELEQSGQYDTEEYKSLSELFDSYFLCRVQPKPEDLAECQANSNLGVYNTMWGPSEAFATGILKDWSVADRLHEISQPTLVISGRYDEATPTQMKVIQEEVPNVRWELFEDSSHCANLEETDKFMRVAAEFISE